MEATYPILPYCLFHAVPLAPGLRDGAEVLSCTGCTFDELMRDGPRKSVEIAISAAQFVEFGHIYDRMMAERLPNVNKFGNEDF